MCAYECLHHRNDRDPRLVGRPVRELRSGHCRGQGAGGRGALCPAAGKYANRDRRSAGGPRRGAWCRDRDALGAADPGTDHGLSVLEHELPSGTDQLPGFHSGLPGVSESREKTSSLPYPDAVKNDVVIALDQGTTSCRALAVDHRGRVAALAQEEFTPFYPRPGWVEQDAAEIWTVQNRVLQKVARQVGGAASVAAIGITNQRETMVVWDRATGQPLHPAIVWQCRRSAGICERLKASGAEPMVRQKTGLLLDPYFSATKLTWLFEAFPDLRAKAENGEMLFGTVDSWLLWNLSGGKRHLTDPSNASRTLLYNLHTGDWDDDLLALFGVPRALLPEIVPSSGRCFDTALDGGGGMVAVAGVAGDQQAALFGQGCLSPGQAKNTYGTGCFLLMNAGNAPPTPDQGLLATVAWQIGGETVYALEGSVFVAGAAIQWLRDGLGLIRSAAETEALARSVEGTGGVYFVPAFTGLGTPYWEPNARGMITGLTRGTTRAHLVRAALEAIAFQTRDIADAMVQSSGLPLPLLRVDGGAAQNDFLLQFQSDLLGIPVARSAIGETTALGASFLAGLAVGFWDKGEIAALRQADQTFRPAMPEAERESQYRGWQRAVRYQCRV
ncbi:MAG: glycerol kinase GlpK [Cytophagales bacterium]|nr:glycerol kinase GlpK [Armatimonadota bacterium]